MKKMNKKEKLEFEKITSTAGMLLIMAMHKLNIPSGISSTYKLKNGETYTLKFEKL